MVYSSWDNGINIEDCEDTIKKYKNSELDIGEVGDDNSKMESPEKQRNSRVYWIQENNLLVRSLFQFILEANDNTFRYNVFNYEQNRQNEQVQFTEYTVDNFYHWHQDNLDSSINGTNRKLSLSVNLSNPKDYEGGNLEFFMGNVKPFDPLKRKQGSVIVFDSSIWHRVTPVTKGIRYSLVTWLWGPNFT